MSELDEVLGSLREMTQLQLLLAFMACFGYALAQGYLVGPKGRRIAWGMTLLSAAGFAFKSTEWMYAAMLAAFAVGGLGLFAGGAWLLSRLLGFSQRPIAGTAAEFPDAAHPDLAAPSAPAPLGHRTLPQHTGPAHSL